ncbi:hypothetical protein KKJ04_14820 [Xenorhabdus bovienii]|uniref:hypothetical protein n=1 Tax=Xenorhabdus bovienii TaxID=40576 RepID=UPI0023B2199A|nr:hypothetical protein [Xenorhabdus bovienii]MDE9446841.1 hypothetical protein [Xenorhabdus bovienii]
MYGTVKEVIERLSRRNPDEPIGALIWDADDVKEGVAMARNEKIDDELAGEVLKRAISAHDANHGVCWDTFVCVVDDIRQKREEQSE